jgi:hypothetical protein
MMLLIVKGQKSNAKIIYTPVQKTPVTKTKHSCTVISIPPSCCIDLNVYYGGRELFSPKVNLPGSSAAVEHWYKSPADFSFAEACLKLQRSSGSVEMTKPTNVISIPPAGCFDLNAYYGGREIC